MSANDILIDMWDRKAGLDGNAKKNMVLSTGGAFQAQGSIITVTGASATLTRAAHGERTVIMGTATQTLTLPAATGSGAKFRIVPGVTATSMKVQVASASDYMRGQAWGIASANVGFQTANTGTVATESDTVTLNGTTTGGIVGTEMEFEDILANVWQVEVDSCGSGTGATPFSAAV